VYSQECPVIASDAVFHEAMYQLQGPCEFGRFRSRVAEDPREVQTTRGVRNLRTSQRYRWESKWTNELEEVFELRKFCSIVANDPREVQTTRGV